MERTTPKVAVSAHFCRQILAIIAVALLTLAGGITFGFSAVLLPQLQNDSNFPYDESLDSWIASISPLAMAMGSIFSGSMSDAIGRKMSQLVLMVPYILGWVIMGVANDNTVMLIGRFVTGVCRGAMRANSMVYIGELTDPKIRPVAFLCPAVAVHIGVLISHSVGKYVHWKASCFIFALPIITAFVILMFLKESPLWLLSKGKIDEGIESFRQFRGNGDSAEKELTTVLEKIKGQSKEYNTFKDTLGIIFSKPFMKSLMIALFLLIATQWNGVSTLSFYAEEIFKKTFSGDVDPIMLMLVTDSIRIAAALFVCLFGKVLPRKISVVTCCFAASLVLLGLVLYLYLAPVGLVWVAVTCMVMYITLATAMTGLSWSYIAEIFPSKVRGFACGLSSSIAFALLFISVKMTPGIMDRFGEPVLYAFFGGVILVSGIVLCFILPETNGRSLQDIEDSMYKKKGDTKKDIGMVTLPETAA